MANENKSVIVQKLRSDLIKFTGKAKWNELAPTLSDQVGVVITDGVKFITEDGGAFWFVDLAASYLQSNHSLLLAECGTFCFLELRPNEEMPGGFTFTISNNAGKIIIHRNMTFDDFPLVEGIKFYAVWQEANNDQRVWVMLLTTEY